MWSGRKLVPFWLLALACGGRERPPEAAAPRPPAPIETASVNAPASAPPAVAVNAPARPDSRYIAALKATLGAESALSLDPALQASVEDELLATGKSGAVIALDPNDGSVRALFSVPGDRGDPMTAQHHPASTFKTFAALAALTNETLAPDTVLTCRGSYDYAGARLTCPAKHGAQDVSRALAASCNTFFYEAATKIHPLKVADMARSFGFGKRTGIELPDEPGVVPGAPDKTKPARPLVDAIGHGDSLATLPQVARAYAAIANGGKLYELHLVSGRKSSDGRITPAPRLAPETIAIPERALAAVRKGLAETVSAEYGRAHEFALEGYPFAGKTGGSNAPPRDGAGEEFDIWFVAYAPVDSPKLLVAARLERVSSTKDAAKLVANVLGAQR
jgi:penicillin-binding protein 2